MADEVDRVAMLSDLEELETCLEQRLGDRIDASARATREAVRRHFDIMVERVESAVKLVAEVNSHHATVLDDHERRIAQIEKSRRRS